MKMGIRLTAHKFDPLDDTQRGTSKEFIPPQIEGWAWVCNTAIPDGGEAISNVRLFWERQHPGYFDGRNLMSVPFEKKSQIEATIDLLFKTSSDVRWAVYASLQGKELDDQKYLHQKYHS